MKNIIFHGPILNHVGIKPLYSARIPSFLIVYMEKIVFLEENRYARRDTCICMYVQIHFKNAYRTYLK